MLKPLLKAIPLFFAALLPAAQPSFAEPSFSPIFAEGVRLFHEGSYESALTAFGKSDNSQRMKADYMKGVSLIKLEREDEAVPYFKSAARSPSIGDWAALNLLEIHERAGNHREILEIAGRFPKDFPHSPLGAKVALIKVRALEAIGRSTEALGLARKQLRKKPYNTHKFLWFIARALEKSGRPANSYRAYQDIYYAYPHTEFAEPARIETVRMKKKYKKTFAHASVKEKTKRVIILMNNRKYAQAEKYIRSLKLSAFSHDIRSRFLMYRANALDRLGRDADSLAVARRVLKEPENPQTPYAMYLMAKIYWNWGENEKAENSLKKLLGRFSWHKVSAKGYYMAGRIEESRGHHAAARKSYEKAISRFPKTVEAQGCLWQIGWRRYQDGDAAGAERAFNRFLKRYPASDSIPRILYWNARAMEEQGKDPSKLLKRLASVYPYSYYSYLRSDGIFHKTEYSKGEPFEKRLEEKALSLLIKKTGDAVRRPPLKGKHLWAMRSAESWLEMGFKKRARPLMEMSAKGIKTGGLETIWIMYRYHKAGYHDLAQRQAWKVQSNPNLTERERRLLVWMMFPLAQWRTVYDEARKNRIDPMAILALIRQESMFDPNIVSSADARGLMQIIPPTALRISRAMREKTFSPGTLFNPEVNIRMGTFYFAALLRKSGGELAPALASYNAGSRVVSKWLKRFSYDPRDVEVFIERIPYPETRGYVKKVLRNYGAYRKTYGEEFYGVESIKMKEEANAGRGN